MNRYIILISLVVVILIVSGCTQTGRIIDRDFDLQAEDLNQEDSDLLPQDIDQPIETTEKDPCEAMVCQASEIICPDGFVAKCPNKCRDSQCSSCEPDCTGHETEEPSCQESWSCSSWSLCENSERRRVCTDQSGCSGEKLEIENCTSLPGGPTVCEENWACSGWSECLEGQQTRTCSDSNDCGTTESRPTETQSCVMPGPPPEEPEPDGLKPIINEIMYNPTQDENYNEWVEIYNPSNQDADLTGWTLCGKALLAGYVDHADEGVHFENGLVLKPHGFALITDGGSGTDVYSNFGVDSNSLAIHVDAGSLCTRLSNAGKTITLEDSNGEIADSVSYSSEFANGNGKTLERKSDGSWEESSTDSGTPGSANSV